MSVSDSHHLPIGPGRFVAVVGPSGAGKDTLVTLARAHFRDDPAVVFPRRIITRPPSAAEDSEAVSDRDFDDTVAAGGFACWWAAHGVRYGLPGTIDQDIRAGRTIVCNVSRGVTRDLCARYAAHRVVLVTAPPDLLAARLAGRGRESAAGIQERIARDAPPEPAVPYAAVIHNVAAPEVAAAALIQLIAGRETPDGAMPTDSSSECQTGGTTDDATRW